MSFKGLLGLLLLVFFAIVYYSDDLSSLGAIQSGSVSDVASLEERPVPKENWHPPGSSTAN
jgi:hypothetical protein